MALGIGRALAPKRTAIVDLDRIRALEHYEPTHVDTIVALRKLETFY